MRLFVAVGVSGSAREAARSAIDRLREEPAVARAAVRWLAPESWHLTLQFLGEVDGPRAVAIGEALAGSWRLEPFVAGLAGGGTFPPGGASRVIWLGVGEGGREAAVLHEETAARLEPIGVRPPARAYHAHLTVGRVKRVSRAVSGPLRQAVEGVEIPRHEWTVDRIILYESRLSRRGAEYRVVAQAMLGTLGARRAADGDTP